jgi:hypothetical protein
VSGVFRFLVSFHYHQKTNLQEIVDSYHGPCEVFADSGAFSAATLGATIKLADYAAWLKEWDHLLTVRATLDVIGDPAATARNTAALERQGLPVLPVFHTGTPYAELEKLVKQYDYMALGGMVPHAKDAPAVLRWLIQCFKIAQETGTVFHGFGQTRLETLRKLPFYSVDSSAWASGMRYGTITLWDDRANKLIQLQGGDRLAARKHARLLRAHGADPALVGRPGFAQKSQRTEPQFRKEVAMMRGAPAIAYLRMGDYLAKRHKVPAPKSLTQRGTSVYLAVDASQHLITAAPVVNGTGVFLAADQGGNCLKDAIEITNQAEAGTNVYLANSLSFNLKGAGQYASEQEGTQVFLAETIPVNLKTVAGHLEAVDGT